MPDLRASVAYLLRLRIPWTADDLATLAAVPLPRARAYVAQLTTATPCKPILKDGKPVLGADGKPLRVPLLQNPDGTLMEPGAVRIAADGQILPGPYARRWIALGSATRPGGNATEYRRQREVRDRLEHRAWQAAKAGNLAVLTSEPGMTGHDQAEGGKNVSTDAQALPLNDVPLTLQQAADQLQVTTDTVRSWIHSGRIQAWRVGPQQIRVSQSEVLRIRAPIKPKRVVRRG